MARPSPYRPYTPDPEQLKLLPDVSGNLINGLGETEYRPPQPIYWHRPETLAHGELQKWFYTQNPDNGAVRAAREARAAIQALEVPEVSGTPVERSAAEWTALLKAHAATLDFELLGITRLKQEWVFEGYSVQQSWMVMIGVAHDYEEISTAPEDCAGAEVVRQYGRGLKAAKDVAAWFRRQGWDAVPHGGPMAGPLVLIPPAIECGFGELGKHGSIINRDYGASFRLACVLTDAPLQATAAESYGVDDFCARCRICSDACPPEAILDDKQWVRGEYKWYVDFDKCIPFFNENFGCGICIAVCPFSRPGVGPRLVEKLARRARGRS